MSMFASYNKNNAKGTLVGNWVEEDALRNATGFSRRLVPESGALRSPERAAERRTESTHNRVLLHAKENGRTTYETTLQASTNYGDGVVRVAPGPRSSLREAQVLETARRIHESELAAKRDAQQRDILAASATSTVQASFLAPETAQLVGASRMPRGRNGARVIDTSVAHLTRGQVDSLDKAKLDVLMQQQQQQQAVAVTRYSYAVATGVGLDFGTSSSDSHNAFARSSAFTNDIHDPTKRHGEATEPGSAHDERVGMTVHQRSALRRLIHACRPSGTASHWDRLKSELAARAVQDNNGAVLELADFRAVITASGTLSEKDAIHAFMFFDGDHIGAVRLDEVLAFCDTQLQHTTL